MPASHGLELARALGHEQVLLLHDRGSGLRAVIAIHDTTLGPAVGGTRMRVYPTMDDALLDAVRLSRAMTAKAALAEMPYGGGKAVILGDPARDKTTGLLLAYAKAVDSLQGRFHSGGDMGIDSADVAVMARATRYVSHGPGGVLDTSALAARGVLAAIAAVARLLGRELRGLHVAVQGLGQVGWRLAAQLHAAGARLTVADVDAARAERARVELGAAVCAPEAVYDVECDVFSPNAGGAVLSGRSIPRLRCRGVAGAANEQLAEPGDGDALQRRGILYAPDYVVNAGGLISLLYETGKTDAEGVLAAVDAIGPRTAALLDRAGREGIASHRLADRLVEERLAAARKGAR